MGTFITKNYFWLSAKTNRTVIKKKIPKKYKIRKLQKKTEICVKYETSRYMHSISQQEHLIFGSIFNLFTNYINLSASLHSKVYHSMQLATWSAFIVSNILLYNYVYLFAPYVNFV